jgi:predicted kinase
MSKLYIIRGLPGAGKSTLAKEIAARTGADHWEADQYFIKNGVYKFDGMSIGEAHDQCHSNFSDSILAGRDVIVSNTFTRLREFEEYVYDAQSCKYDVIIIECLENYGSIHNVPDSSMERMRSRWEPNSKLQEIQAKASMAFEFDWEDITLLNQDEFDLHEMLPI